MENTLLIILTCIVCALGIGYIVYKVVKIAAMTPENRKKTILTYLMGLVSAAEDEIGAGHGADKLEYVEDYFKSKAPTTYRIILRFIGKQNLKNLIEDALDTVKMAFGEHIELIDSEHTEDK